MNKKKHKPIFNIILISTLLLVSPFIYGQKREFKIYTNSKGHFSFVIPKSWSIKYSYEQEGLICIPTNSKEKEKYADCFEGIIFRIYLFKTNLDSTLLSNFYFKIGNDFYTNDRFRDSIKTKNISGRNWRGIYHNNICGVGCKESGFHAAGGQCEFIYFSKNNLTVCITTNGTEFDKSILTRLLKSFSFL